MLFLCYFWHIFHSKYKCYEVALIHFRLNLDVCFVMITALELTQKEKSYNVEQQIDDLKITY